MLNIELSNIRSISYKNVDFFPGINIIVGKNGLGKTTLCMAPLIAFYGRTFSSKGYRSIIKKGESEGHVCVKFITPSQKQIVVDRHISLKDSSNVSVYIDNQHVEIDPSELIPQEISEFMYLQTEKLDLFKYFENIDDYVELYNSKAKQIETFLVELEKIKTKKNTLEKYYKQELEKEEQNLKNYEKRITEIENRIKTIKSKLYIKTQEEFAKFLQIYENAKEEFTKRITSEEENRKKMAENLNNEIKLLKAELDKLFVEKEREKSESIKNLEKEKFQKEKKLSDEYNLTIGALKNQLENVKKELSRISQIQGEKICPLCGKELDSDEVEKLCKEYETHYSQIEKNIKEENEKFKNQQTSLNQEYENLKKQILKSIDEKYDENIKNKKEKIESLNEKLKNLQNFSLSTEEKKQIFIEIKNKFFGDMAELINKEFVEMHDKAFKELSNLEIQLDFEKDNLEKIKHNITSLHKKLKDLEKYFVVDKYMENCIQARAILKKVNKKDIKQHLSAKIYDIVNSITLRYSNIFPVKIIPELRQVKDNYNIEFSAVNLHGEVVNINELSSGEFVIGKIIINLVMRDFLRLLPQYKNTEFLNIMFLDEHLDKLDENNAQMIIEILQGLEDFTFIIVTHRIDLVNSFSNANIIYM